jgi:uncharacterized membrane protein
MKYLLVFLLLLPLAAAEENYGDVKISVSREGLVTISGTTDYPGLIVKNSPDFTSKKGRYWLLNITHPEIFSEYTYELSLPENTIINYIRTPNVINIKDGKGIVISGSGRNSPFVLVVQYQIGNAYDNLWIYLASVAFGAIAIVLIKRYKSQKPTSVPVLTDRQKQIIDLVKKGPLSQAQIERNTGMPKSSLSRNIDVLVRKGILEKHDKGMVNIISLKK